MRLTDVWVVAQQDKDVWELGGVFTKEQLADLACMLPTDCYWKVKLNEEAPRGTVIREDAIFPRLTIPEGWYLIPPIEAVQGDGILLPDSTVVVLDDKMFNKFPLDQRRSSWAVRRKS
jgi:hypothetical protein